MVKMAIKPLINIFLIYSYSTIFPKVSIRTKEPCFTIVPSKFLCSFNVRDGYFGVY